MEILFPKCVNCCCLSENPGRFFLSKMIFLSLRKQETLINLFSHAVKVRDYTSHKRKLQFTATEFGFGKDLLIIECCDCY